jgi:hypothetical protein
MLRTRRLPQALKAKLDAACARLEGEARAEAEAARPAYKGSLHDLSETAR